MGSFTYLSLGCRYEAEVLEKEILVVVAPDTLKVPTAVTRRLIFMGSEIWLSLSCIVQKLNFPQVSIVVGDDGKIKCRGPRSLGTSVMKTQEAEMSWRKLFSFSFSQSPQAYVHGLTVTAVERGWIVSSYSTFSNALQLHWDCADIAPLCFPALLHEY